MKLIRINTLEELKNLDLTNLVVEEDIDIEIRLKLTNVDLEYPINIHHNLAKKSSRVFLKLALYGKSKLNIPVEMHVMKGAIDTSTNFSALVYILSKNAQAKVTPGLFIHEKNIQAASHGVVIKNIKDADLSYLNSRGIEKNKAKEMIICI